MEDVAVGETAGPVHEEPVEGVADAAGEGAEPVEALTGTGSGSGERHGERSAEDEAVLVMSVQSMLFATPTTMPEPGVNW